MQQVDACQGVIQRLGGLLTWFTGEELGSVLTTFQRHTAFLDSPAIARNTTPSRPSCGAMPRLNRSPSAPGLSSPPPRARAMPGSLSPAA